VPPSAVLEKWPRDRNQNDADRGAHGGEAMRLGFMSEIEVPDDFDTMGREEIERLLTGGS
jgi:hypothetical protein